jgi:hypothetical protein
MEWNPSMLAAPDAGISSQPTRFIDAVWIYQGILKLGGDIALHPNKLAMLAPHGAGAPLTKEVTPWQHDPGGLRPALAG